MPTALLGPIDGTGGIAVIHKGYIDFFSHTSSEPQQSQQCAAANREAMIEIVSLLSSRMCRSSALVVRCFPHVFALQIAEERFR